MKKLYFLCWLLLGAFTGASAQTFIGHITTDQEHFSQHSLAQLGEDYIVAGTQSFSGVNGGSEIKLLRIDHTGNVVWSKDFNFGTQDAFVGAVLVDSDDNIVLTGYVGTNNGAKDLLIAKVDASGNLLGELEVNDPPLTSGGFDYALYGEDISQNGDGDYLVAGTGSALPISDSSQKYGFALAIDPGLTGVVWEEKFFPASGTTMTSKNSINAVTKVPAGDPPTGQEVFLLTGTTSSGGGFLGEGFLALLDGNGTIIWETSYGNAIHNGGLAVYNPDEGAFYVSYT